MIIPTIATFNCGGTLNSNPSKKDDSSFKWKGKQIAWARGSRDTARGFILPKRGTSRNTMFAEAEWSYKRIIIISYHEHLMSAPFFAPFCTGVGVGVCQKMLRTTSHKLPPNSWSSGREERKKGFSCAVFSGVSFPAWNDNRSKRARF